jgi:O-antigen/teichoic acid export membrane protein
VSEPQPRQGFTSTVLRGAGIGGAGFVLTQTLSVAFAVVLARVATPENFGEFAAGSILIAVGGILSESGMLAALIQRRDRIEEAANTAFAATILAGIGLGLLALGLAPAVGLLFDDRDVGVVAAAMSGVLVLNAFQIVPNALMQRRFSFLRRVVTDPLGIIGFGATAAVACAAGMGVWGLVLGAYVGTFVHASVCWLLARWRPRPRLASFSMWRELNAFSKYVVGSELVVRSRSLLETFLLGRFVSTASLGQYTYAVRIAGQPHWALVNAAYFVIYPTFARIAPDEQRFQSAFLRALRWVALISLPLSLILFPFGEPLAVLLLGQTWRPAGEAVMALCLFAAGHSLAGLAGEAAKAAGRSDLLLKRDLVSLFLAAASMLALLEFGVVGIAAAVSLSSAGMAAYALHRLSRILDLPLRRLVEEIWPPTVAAVGMAAVFYPLEHLVLDAGGREPLPGLALLAVEGALAVLIYVVLVRLLAPATAGELFRAAGMGWSRVSRRRPNDGAQAKEAERRPVPR